MKWCSKTRTVISFLYLLLIITLHTKSSHSKGSSKNQFKKYLDSLRRENSEEPPGPREDSYKFPGPSLFPFNTSNIYICNNSSSSSGCLNNNYNVVDISNSIGRSSQNFDTVAKAVVNKSANKKRGIWDQDVSRNRNPLLDTHQTPFQRIVINTRFHRTKRRVSNNLVDHEDGPSSRSLPYDENPFVKGRKHPGGGNPKIDDIIHGIMKLLGGNVKLKAPESTDTKLTTFSDDLSHYVTSTRINNRGPPRLPLLPFGILNPAGPIRPPVTPPIDNVDANNPQFVANTRPPFLVPLPPQLNSRPGGLPPYVTGIPIPEDVLSHIMGTQLNPSEDSIPSTTVTPLFASSGEEVPETTTTEKPEEVDASEDENKTLESIIHHSSTTSEVEELLTTSLESSLQDVPSSTSLFQSPSLHILNSSPSPLSSVTPVVSKTSVKSINLISSKPSTSLVVKSFAESVTTTTTATTINNEILTTISVTNIDSITTSEIPQSLLLKIKASETTTTSVEPVSLHRTSNTFMPITSAEPFQFSNFPTLLPHPINLRPTSVSRPPYATTGHPGLVFEDTVGPRPPSVSPSVYQGEVITAYKPFDMRPDVFDVTVSALQGYGSPPSQAVARPPNRYPGGVAPVVVTTAKDVADRSVFIDGRKTYFDLIPATNQLLGTTRAQTLGVGTVIPEAVQPAPTFTKGVFHTEAPPGFSPPISKLKKPPKNRPPSTLGPPKRIDTCIVGYDTTCKEELGEVCRTEGDVSSCYCRPGTARKKSRSKCKKSVLLHLSLKVDRVGNRRIVWSGNYANPEAKEYQLLHYEAEKALDSALGQSRAMSGLYMDSSVNKFYSLGGRVIVNSTVKLLHTPQTSSPTIRKSLQRHLIKVIQSNNNFVGNSMLSVEGPLNPVPDVSDVNECFDSSLYDCHSEAVCTNTFGSYTCDCKTGFTDRYPDDPNKSGRFCDSCSRDFCSKRGECRIEDNGRHVCICEGNYYGSRCEVDGEVIAVAVGASVAAVVIIILTLIFLCMWSRRWKAQDRKTEIMSRFPGGGFFGGFLGGRGGGMGGGGRSAFSVDIRQKGGAPRNYAITMEDRIRWAQIAENLTQQNVYTEQTSPSDRNGASSSADLAASVQNTLVKILLEGKLTRQEEKGGGGNFVQEVLRLFKRRGHSKPKKDFLTPEEALTLHQMITLQAQLNHENQPEQMRSTAFYEQRKVLPAPSEYASVGTMSGIPPQQFGMHQLNPAQYMPQAYGAGGSSKTLSNYSQYGMNPCIKAPSAGGISRAPTMGARTPLPVRDLLGGTSLGPFGGGLANKGGNKDGIGALLTESSEEDPDRPYQLPRPKSRSSVLDNDDFYFDPDDMMTSHPRSQYLPPLPSSPPPPVPYQFDQFFKSKFP